jgi:hypothetical protein
MTFFFTKLSTTKHVNMAVKIALSHKTTYTFDRSVKLYPHVLDCDQQHILEQPLKAILLKYLRKSFYKLATRSF